ncbi:hypothetical protein [Budvicia aquatica]|uniref:Uncharacterized protein n=1 Tax=Budvicia aquatica TaxID=82979 RepID=A0A2C6DTN4_9GAMM|nr:hypothetical protein [Budvicia aquatica]PHI31692.1 hypothetical protein CRN84_21340 [Budvicia aquatica]VFS52446.1 Uncharacterised protein [Budvicia aquatica]
MTRYQEILQFSQMYNKREKYLTNIESREKSLLERFQRAINSTTNTPKIYAGTDVYYNLNYTYGESYTWLLMNKHQQNNQALCNFIAVTFMNMFVSGVAEYEGYYGYSTSFNRQGYQLLMLMATHNVEMANFCYPGLKDNVANGVLTKSVLGLKASHVSPQRLGILGYGILASIHNEAFNWNTVQIPYDPLYTNFVKNILYSEDEVLISEGIHSLLDSHLTWSSRGLYLEEEAPSVGYDYSEYYSLLWPFEYQAIKNIRGQRGLTTPKITHPLCENLLATTEHRTDFSQWQAPEWFFPLMDRLIEIEPRIAEAKRFFK